MKQFQQGQIDIRNCDCLEYLATIDNGVVDLVLIDPPYEVSRDTNFKSGEVKGIDTDRFRVSMNFGDWDYGFDKLEMVIKEVYRILKNGGTLICFYDLWKISTLKEYFLGANFKQLRFIEWLKTNPVPLNSKTNYLTNAREIAVLGVKVGRSTFNSQYDTGIYRFPICHDKNRFHPTQKPLELIEALVEKHSNPGDLVLDCFLGSGTTAVACQKLGRHFTGCELCEGYFQKAIDRVGHNQEKSAEKARWYALCGTQRQCRWKSGNMEPQAFASSRNNLRSLCLGEDRKHSESSSK